MLKITGRAISAIRYSVGARVYLPVIPSIMIRAPRMVAVRGPEVNGARAGCCCRSRYMARGPSSVAVAAQWGR